MSNKKLILIDGSAYIFRAFHALPPMNRKDGTPVNAVYGFTNMVMKLVDDLNPDHVIVVLDQARENFRNQIYYCKSTIHIYNSILGSIFETGSYRFDIRNLIFRYKI